MNSKENAVEEALAASAAAKATYIGGYGGAVLAWLSSANWLAVMGVFVGVMGLLVNTLFSYRRDKREAQLHDIKLQELSASKPPPPEVS